MASVACRSDWEDSQGDVSSGSTEECSQASARKRQRQLSRDFSKKSHDIQSACDGNVVPAAAQESLGVDMLQEGVGESYWPNGHFLTDVTDSPLLRYQDWTMLEQLATVGENNCNLTPSSVPFASEPCESTQCSDDLLQEDAGQCHSADDWVSGLLDLAYLEEMCELLDRI